MNILKLTVKKDVFDKLASKEQKYVYVEANGYWIRRLALNSADSFEKLKETQAFRTFDSISVTCAKENAEYAFKTIRTGYEDMTKDNEDTGFCIWIDNNSNDSKEDIESNESLLEKYAGKEIDEKYIIPVGKISEVPSETMKEAIEKYNPNVEFNEETGELIVPGVTREVYTKDIFIEDDTETYKDVELETGIQDNEIFVTNVKKDASEKFDMDEVIDFIITVIAEYDNVVIVNRPNIIITSNGRIYGTKERLDLNNDEEIRVNIGTEKLYDDTNDDKDFIKKIEEYLIDYAKTGFIFIWKDGCEVVNTPTGRYIKLKMTKKLYLNR